jgi:hypothetical protein
MIGREDLFGSIRRPSDLSIDPFVENWEVGGWWQSNSLGRQSRIPMKGLMVGGGALFLYSVDAGGVFSPRPVIFVGPGCEIAVAPGSPIRPRHAEDVERKNPFKWEIEGCTLLVARTPERGF